MAEAVKVCCRFRGGQAAGNEWRFDPDGLSLTAPAGGPYAAQKFTFDAVLDSDCSQENAYNITSRETVTSLLNGFNGTIFMYGQSGSGKTFTMLGPDIVVETITKGVAEENAAVPEEVQDLYGVIPRAIFDIFNEINRMIEAHGAQVELKINYYEIY